MSAITPRIFYLCDACEEYFYFNDDSVPSKCPDCGEGNLVKNCSFCGNKFEECTCTEEELQKRCPNCGFIKTECKCNS